MRGPGTKLQQTERRGRVSENSLGWREGAMARDGPGTDKGRAKAREARPGNTGSEQLGLARVDSLRHGNRAGLDQAQNWCADSLAWREGGKVTGCQARARTRCRASQARARATGQGQGQGQDQVRARARAGPHRRAKALPAPTKRRLVPAGNII